MIGLIVLGVAFIFFLVVAFFAAKTWHVGHVVAMSFLFLFTLLFLYMTAALMRTHNEFRPSYEKAVADLEREQQRELTLRYGDPSKPAGEDTLAGERALARIEAAGRGRVWGNVRRQPSRDGIMLNMARWTSKGYAKIGKEDEVDTPVDEAAEDDALEGEDAVEGDEGVAVVGNPHGIEVGQFVYAFKELPINQLTAAQQTYYFGALGDGEDSLAARDTRGFCRVPVAYVGKFVVKEATDQALTVLPATAPTDAQLAQMNNELPWALYEKLPQDNHSVFANLPGGTSIENLVPLQRLRQAGIGISDAAYGRMIEDYKRDGGQATGREMPRRLRQQVEFVVDEHTVVVDVGEVAPGTDTPFDVQGRAQIPSLIQGADTKFSKGDVATFDAETAQRLIQSGKAKAVGQPTYARQLSNFEYELDAHAIRVSEVVDEKRNVETQVAALTASLNRVRSQIDKLLNELTLLQQDKQGFETERDELKAYRDVLEQRLLVLKGRLGIPVESMEGSRLENGAVLGMK